MFFIFSLLEFLCWDFFRDDIKSIISDNILLLLVLFCEVWGLVLGFVFFVIGVLYFFFVIFRMNDLYDICWYFAFLICRVFLFLCDIDIFCGDFITFLMDIIGNLRFFVIDVSNVFIRFGLICFFEDFDDILFDFFFFFFEVDLFFFFCDFLYFGRLEVFWVFLFDLFWFVFIFFICSGEVILGDFILLLFDFCLYVMGNIGLEVFFVFCIELIGIGEFIDILEDFLIKILGEFIFVLFFWI